ncbi:hypothetical protein CAC42_2245 [Sphaceloma murrayae]|uniref:J domain-containing protein n=1 Tax=Sphaceloma murrayae TaxID=2082308 RepID=A0A2K1QIN2_9PEZI|nr:hypothetical protein CAC42_2245 [Sphaceloma murrayae]
MVKPDVKVNYYAALEIGSDASVDDIKKQYRKLALKYHPDRNPGKEEEFNSKFQNISAAFEVLSDPTTKAKYDVDRKRASVSGAATRPGASGRTGNPYAASSNFAPPPRRTQDPTGWTRAGATGADRFTNFPGPGPTARAEPKKAAYSEAWSTFGPGARRGSQKPNPQQQHQQANANASSQRRPPPPPPPPRDNAAPPSRPDLPPRDAQKEADIRSSFAHRPAPANMSPQARTAWAHYNDKSQQSQRPTFSRTNTSSRTPRANAFDPNAPGDNERPASGGTSGYTHHFKEPDPNMNNLYAGKPSASQHNVPNAYSTSRTPSVDGRMPYQPQHRHSAYQHTSGEKTYINSDQLKRSQSTRDATQLHEQQRSPRAFHSRPRSASPAKGAADGKPKVPTFDVGMDSDEISTSDDSISSGSDANARGTGPFGSQRPRPKKNPTAPSTRLNGTPGGAPPHAGNQGRRGSQTQQPSRHNSGSAQGGQGPNGNIFKHFDFDQADHAKSRSAEEINTTFSPTASAPTFSGVPGTKPISPAASRRPSPPKRTRETLSARPSRNHINTRVSNEFRAPVSPTSVPYPQNPPLFGEVPQTAGPEREKTFSPDQWSNHQFFTPQGASLSRGPSLRRNSHTSVNKGPTAPRPASVTSANDGDTERDSGSAHSIASGGDAMDVDPAPPAQQATAKTARAYNQPPSQWRMSQNNMPPPPPSAPPDSAAAQARRRSSVRSSTDPTNTIPDLNPLASTLHPTNAGLNDLSSLSTSIPFQSKPSPHHPSSLFAEVAPSTPLPSIPVAPQPPQRLTKATWKEYTARTHAYLSAHHQLRRQFEERARETVAMEEAVLGRGPSGLEARGEGSEGMVGIEALIKRAREEERWEELRGVAAGKFAGAVAEFARVKGRVGQLAEEGRLVE